MAVDTAVLPGVPTMETESYWRQTYRHKQRKYFEKKDKDILDEMTRKQTNQQTKNLHIKATYRDTAQHWNIKAGSWPKFRKSMIIGRDLQNTSLCVFYVSNSEGKHPSNYSWDFSCKK